MNESGQEILENKKVLMCAKSHVPNEETASAIREARASQLERFDNVDELMSYLLKDE